MLDDAANVVQRYFRQAGIQIAGEQVDAILRQGLVDVHAAAVITDQRLGHEGSGLTIAGGHVLYHVLQTLYLVGLTHQGVELDADFGLASRGDFVVMHFGHQPHRFQTQAHSGAEILHRIHRWYREVATLDTRTVAEVATLVSALGIPAGLGGIDLAEATTDVGTPAHVVENEKLVFRTKEGGVADTGGFQIGLGATRQGARIPLVTLHGVGFDDITGQDQGRLLEKRIDGSSHGIGHQDHVRLLDALPAGDGRAVEHLAVLEYILIHGADGHGDVLLLATGVRETIIHELNALLLDQLHHISSIHCH